HLNDPMIGELKNEEKYRSILKKIYILKNDTHVSRSKIMMDDEQALLFVHQLSDYMEKERPYLNNDLSLRFLASAINIHPNKLSWLLNQQFNKNFNQFVNAYRIEHFKKAAFNPSNTHLSIMGMAYESGFNSKTVFNTYFKNE